MGCGRKECAWSNSLLSKNGVPKLHKDHWWYTHNQSLPPWQSHRIDELPRVVFPHSSKWTTKWLSSTPRWKPVQGTQCQGLKEIWHLFEQARTLLSLNDIAGVHCYFGRPSSILPYYGFWSLTQKTKDHTENEITCLAVQSGDRAFTWQAERNMALPPKLFWCKC